MWNNLAYGGKLRNNTVNQFYVLHMTEVCKFIHFNVRKKSVSYFISKGHASMNSGASKSSNQIDIYALSRGSKLCA